MIGIVAPGGEWWRNLVDLIEACPAPIQPQWAYRDMRKERGDLTGRTLTPPEQTASRFIKPPAQGGIQGMQSLNRVKIERVGVHVDLMDHAL